MSFLTRLKRWKNKSTGGSLPADYSMDEVNMNALSDSIERMITVHNDLYADMVISGGLEANRVGLVNDITKCLAYGKGNRTQQLADTTGHTYTALKDTYIHLDTLTSNYTFNEVGNGAGAPALGANEILVIKVITDATQITSTVDISNRVLNGKVQTGSINYVVGAGTANALTATFDPPFTTLVDGMEISFRAILANTGSSFFKLDQLANTLIKKHSGGILVNLDPGDIEINGTHILTYQGINTLWILENPATGVTTTASNVFTANQTIRKATPRLLIDGTSATVPAITFQRDGVTKSLFLWDETNNEVALTNAAGLSKFGYDVVNDKMSRGIVPLARMMVGNVGSRNSGSVTILGTKTQITSLNLSGLKVDDQIIISLDVLFSKLTIAGMINLELDQIGGTAALDFTPGGGTLTAAGQGSYVPANTSARIHLTVNVLVTSTGDGLATINAGASSTGSNSTVSAFDGSLYAMALLGS